MTRMSAMPMFADAHTAPAHCCACMTTSCAMMKDTAVAAVSFLIAIVRVLVGLIVRIIGPVKAKP